jgi:hypothetical protein
VFPEGIPASNRSGRFMLDLIEANRRLLVKAGVPAGKIFDSGLCTHCDKQFFSFRRQPDDPGRMISFIVRL